MMNNILNQATINAASYKELQVLAKNHGIKASGKGVTAESLREQLIALIPVEPANSISVGDLDITRDNVPDVTEETPVVSNTDTVKVQVMNYKKETKDYVWEVEEVKRLTQKQMVNMSVLYSIAERIFTDDLDENGKGRHKAVFVADKASHVAIQGKRYVNDYKLIAIIKYVLKTSNMTTVNNCIMYLRQLRFIAPVHTYKLRYAVSDKFEAWMNEFGATTK